MFLFINIVEKGVVGFYGIDRSVHSVLFGFPGGLFNVSLNLPFPFSPAEQIDPIGGKQNGRHGRGWVGLFPDLSEKKPEQVANKPRGSDECQYEKVQSREKCSRKDYV